MPNAIEGLGHDGSMRGNANHYKMVGDNGRTVNKRHLIIKWSAVDLFSGSVSERVITGGARFAARSLNH